MKGKLVMTVKEAENHEAWLEMRNKGIGGSDIAAIVGMTPYKSQFKLWLEKTGQAEPEDLSDNEAVYWGLVLEQAVADRFSEITGKKVRKCGTLADEDMPFMLANVDRMVVGEDAGLECKTCNAFSKNKWDGDELPDSYYLQCQFYMAVTGCAKWYIACLIGGQKFVWKEIPRNEDDIAAIRQAASDFWHKVQDNIMPPMDGTEDCSKALSVHFKAEQGLEMEFPTAASETLERLKDLKLTIDELTKSKTLEENILKEMLGEAEIGRCGDYKVTWKEQSGRTTVDSKKLKTELPDVYKKYSKIGQPVRVFKVAM